jgi:photosystem II stability/assembly factor-like uncharacterized protein
LPVSYLFDVKALSPSDVWVAGHSAPDGRTNTPQVQVTHDGGSHWTPACLGVPAMGDTMAVHFTSPDDGWAMGWGWGAAGSANGHSFAAHTQDGGSSWSQATLPEGIAGLRDIAFTDKKHGFAVGAAQNAYPNDSVLLATDDGGATWKRSDLPGAGGVYAIDFADSAHGVIAGAGPDGHQILYTADGGASWQAATVPPGRGALHDIVLVDAERGFAVGDNAGILATMDGGRTWEKRVDTVEGGLMWGLTFSDPQHGWAVGGGTKGQVYGTTDGGTTWTYLSTTPGPSLQAVSFADAQHGFAIANQRPCLYSTTDGGVTWTGRALNGTVACTQ